MDNEKEVQNSNIRNERVDKIKKWIKNPFNLMLVIVLLFTFGIRAYYLFGNLNQPLWWDESEYATMAKHIALGTPDWVSAIRTPYFPMLISPIYMLGFGENGVKFFEILLITASVLLIYLILRRLYDEKIAIIASTLGAVFWSTIFWSIRITTDFPALFFQLLTIFFFLKYTDEGKIKNVLLVIVSLALAILMRTQSMLLIGILLIYLIFAKGKDLLNKKFIIGITICIIVAVAFFFTMGKGYITTNQFTQPIYWGAFSFIGVYLEGFLILFFLLGLIFAGTKLVLAYDQIKTNRETRSDFFLFLILIIWFGFIIFYIRGTEDRWLYLTMLPIFAITGKGFMKIYEWISKYTKTIAVILIVLLLGFGAYYELQHANGIIQQKKESYAPVKDSGLWMKQYSNQGDIIISASLPQHLYYSERKVYDYYFNNGPNQTEFDFITNLDKIKPRYIILSSFEPGFTPQWAYGFPEKYKDLLTPVKVYFADKEQTQPLLVIFEVNYNLPRPT